VRVFFDGWSLVYQPNHPEAMHLRELLNHCPDDCELNLALPGQVDERSGLPAKVRQVIQSAENTPTSHLRWEQRTLNEIAQQGHADLLHLTTPTPALFGKLPTVVSPAGFAQAVNRTGSSLASRLRQALSYGAMQRVAAVFWPEELPQPSYPARIIRLPGLVGPDFNPNELPDLSRLRPLNVPETYLLYHGPQDHSTLHRLLATWSWAAGSIGDLYPLVMVGFQQEDLRQELLELAEQANLAAYLVILPEVPPGTLPSLYRGSSGLLHFGEISAWGGPVRYALACGKPVIGDETPAADVLVGPAGYLFPREEARRMGASLLSIVVNEDVAIALRDAAIKQAAAWQSELFPERLLQAYRQVLGESTDA
jgi:glycosyltransferase involved in cell wall biosynthesis